MAWSRALRRCLFVMDGQIAAEREKKQMRAMRIEHIGGGRVMRTFRLGDRQVMSGETLDADTLARMNTVNRNSLIDNGYITVWPKSGDAAPPAAAPAATAAEGAQRFVINKGFGKFAVVEGRLLNDEPLDRKGAEALAAEGQPAKH